jgi:small subunit ribosomal protein S16
MGKIRNPQYRIVVADARTKRDGRAIEFLGIYHPKEEPSLIEVKSDRVQHWLQVGAQPSEAVRAILSKTGDWQMFKGLPAPEPLKVKPARADRRAIYEAEAQAAAGVATTETKPARKTTARKAESKAEAPAGPAAADAPKAAPDAPKAAPDVPKAAPDVPKAAADAPKAAPDVPKAAADAPATAPADAPAAAPAAETTEEQVGAGTGETA